MGGCVVSARLALPFFSSSSFLFSPSIVLSACLSVRLLLSSSPLRCFYLDLFFLFATLLALAIPPCTQQQCALHHTAPHLTIL